MGPLARSGAERRRIDRRHTVTLSGALGGVKARRYFGSLVTQYGVDAFGDGKSNRAFTA